MKWIIDCGHGGMAFGKYVTAGKRSPEIPPGIYEGEFNRQMAEAISLYLDDESLILTPGPINVSLSARVKMVNKIISDNEGERIALVSVHANAFGRTPRWHTANGYAVFTKRNPDLSSRRMAEFVLNGMSKSSHLVSMQSRGLKHMDFAIIKRTACPAILMECGFMTSKHDVEFLNNKASRYLMAEAICDGLNRYGKRGTS